MALRCLAALLILIFSSCEEPFQYNPNKVKVKSSDKNTNQKNIDNLLSGNAQEGPLNFILIADTHHSYEELEDLVAIINNLNDVDFVIVAGDITNFGLQTEYEDYLERMNKLEIPFITVIGNHDHLGNGLRVYEEMFGKTNFSFVFKKCKFICMDTNSREHNFNGLVPDNGFLNSELMYGQPFDYAIVAGHVAPFSGDFDPNLVNGFAGAMTNSGKVKLSMHGHTNTFEILSPYNNNIPYVVADDLNDRSYVRVVIDQGFGSVDTVKF